jgi:hypothetical protein
MIGEVLDRFRQRFLDHIRRMEAGGQPMIAVRMDRRSRDLEENGS